jgi:hypothetical protein
MKRRFLNGKFIAFLVLVIVLIILTHTGGCKKDTTVPADPNPIVVTKTGCKSGFLSADSSNQDCIEYRLTNNILHIKHINAAFNCCPNKVYAVAVISHDSILITEKEILTQPCKCNCLYDIEYDIPDVTDSSYVIIVNEPYVMNETDRLIFNMSPVISSIGAFCKTRNMYPWN